MMATGDLRFSGLIDDCYTQIGSYVYMTVQAAVLLKGVGTRQARSKSSLRSPFFESVVRCEDLHLIFFIE